MGTVGMMRTAWRLRGATLVEMMVAMGILTFVFAFSGFMLMMMSRNAYNINRQIRGQIASASAAERATNLLRSAAYFALWPADQILENATVTRVRFAMPGAGSAVTTHVLCYNPVKKQMEYYDSESKVTFPTSDSEGRPIPSGAPTMKYMNISNMMFNWETEYRVTLHIWYEYAGYALKPPGVERKQFGRFVTDIIARRHFMDQGIQNYAISDIATSSPATL
ncbi:MAG: PilW family protein [Candidatus Sumerlaeaceae bacterium]